MVRWDGQDVRLLRGAIRNLVRRFSLSERADVSCCGMTVAQAATLEALHVRGPMRLSRLGVRLGIRPSTLTRNLERLVDRGWVERVADRDDLRARTVRLTRKGNRAAREVERQELRFAAAVLERVSADSRRTVLGGLEQLLLALRQATESCCAGAFDHLVKEFPRAEARRRKSE